MLKSSSQFAILAIFTSLAFPFLRRRYVSTVGSRSAFFANYLDIVGSLKQASRLLTIVTAWISSDVVTSVRSGIPKSSLTFADDCGCLDFIRRRYFSTIWDLLQIESRVADDYFGLTYPHCLLEKCSLILCVLALSLRLKCCWCVVCSCESKFLIQLINSVCLNWC